MTQNITAEQAVAAVQIEAAAMEIADTLFDSVLTTLYVEPTGVFADIVGEVKGNRDVATLRLWNAKEEGGEFVMVASVSTRGNTVATMDFFEDAGFERVGKVLRARAFRFAG
jgi:hypothetical protein